mgnify:CR=1 FL=1
MALALLVLAGSAAAGRQWAPSHVTLLTKNTLCSCVSKDGAFEVAERPFLQQSLA